MPAIKESSGNSDAGATPQPDLAPRRPVWPVVAALPGLAVAFLAAFSWHAWRETEQTQLEYLSTVAESAAKTTDSYFEQLAMGLGGLAEEITRTGPEVDLDQAYRLVGRFRDLHPELFNVTLIRGDGQTLLTARDPPSPALPSLAQAPSFRRFLEELPQSGSAQLGQTMISVVSRQPIVPFRFPVRAPDGGPALVLSANLPADHLKRPWDDTPLARFAMFALLRDDGYLLSRFPIPDRIEMQKLYGAPLAGPVLAHLRSNGFPASGHCTGVSAVDGTKLLFVFRRLPHYPVNFIVAVPTAILEAAWLQSIRVPFLLTAMLAAGGVLTIWRHDRQRRSAEKAIERVNRVLRMVSAGNEVLLRATNEQELFARMCRVIVDAGGYHMAWVGVPDDDTGRTIRPVASAGSEDGPLGESSIALPLKGESGLFGCLNLYSKDSQAFGPEEVGLLEGLAENTAFGVSALRQRQRREESEERYRALFEHMQIGFTLREIVRDGAGKPVDCRFLAVNQAFLANRGLNRDQVVGRRLTEIYPDTGQEPVDWIGLCAEVAETGKEFHFETRSHASRQWKEVTAYRPGPNQVAVLFNDITERKRLESEFEQYRRVVLASIDGFWMIERTGRIVDANEAVCRMLGYERDELLGLHIADLEAVESPEETATHIRAIIEVGSSRFDSQLRRKDGGIVDVSISALYLPSLGERYCAFVSDITERKRTEHLLKENESRLRLALDAARQGWFELDVQTGEVLNSEEYVRMLGFDPATFATDLETWRRNLHPDDLDGVQQAFRRSLEPGEGLDVEYRRRTRADRWIWLRTVGRVVAWTADGKPLRMVGIHMDVTARKQAESRLQLAASVFTHAREGIVITETDGTIVEVNEAFTQITGFDRAEAIGKTPRILKSGQHPPAFYAAMWRSLMENGYWAGEIWNRRNNGEIYPETLTITAVRDGRGTIRNFVAMFTDIKVLKEHQQQMEHLAHYDVLTGLPNRVLLADRLQQAIVQSQRRGGGVAVAYIDLDGFKEVNDRHGHAVGDELLVHVAQHMKSALRKGDTLARFGGDEFVAVLADLEQRQDGEPLLARLLKAANGPVTVRGTELRISASIGASVCPQDGTDADLLIRQADQAMYLAKRGGRNCYHLFDRDEGDAGKVRGEVLKAMRQALEREEFELHYQPKVNMRTGLVVGAEALIRWRHPERGLLSPGSFLPDVEDHPFGIELGEWVMGTALKQVAAWRQADLRLPVSVNISARQLQQSDFATRLADRLRSSPEVPPSWLELEILETSALLDVNAVTMLMEACQKIGVRFALDDFGTGYSSLTYLRRLPAELLKIDQAFVRDMLQDRNDLAIVDGIISLAKAFSREVIAEGVETIGHGGLLMSLGCDLAQGYAIARPMPAEDMAAWIARWERDEAKNWMRLAATDRAAVS